MNIVKIAIVGSLLIGGVVLFTENGSMLKLLNENKALELNKTFEGCLYERKNVWTPVEVREVLQAGALEICAGKSLGEYIRFETEERNYELPTGGYKKEKWRLIVEDYKDNGVYKHHGTVSAVSNLAEGDYTYWVGTISKVKINVGENK